MEIAELFEQINIIKESYFKSQLKLEAEKEKHAETRVLIQDTIQNNKTTQEALQKLSLEEEQAQVRVRELATFLEHRTITEAALQRQVVEAQTKLEEVKRAKHKARFQSDRVLTHRDTFLRFSQDQFYPRMIRNYKEEEKALLETVQSLQRRSEILDAKLLEAKEIEKVKLRRCL